MADDGGRSVEVQWFSWHGAADGADQLLSAMHDECGRHLEKFQP